MGTVGSVADERAVVVARRAAEQALASGVELPDDLALWRLAGGRPTADPVAGEPEELGRLLEASFASDRRQRQGAHYTPTPVATELVERALRRHERPQVGDPACGGGALLLAAARHLAARGQPRPEVIGRLFGIDVDPVAVATTEAALTLWARVRPPAGHLVVGDALLDAIAWPLLDVVVGNPPFLSQLDAVTTRPAALSMRLRERYGDAVRAYTDTAGLFLVAASDLAARGGTVALLQPQAVLAARDAAGVRDAVRARGRLTDVWFPPEASFDASVDVCVPVVEIGSADPGRSWSAHLARRHGVPDVELVALRTVADDATVTAAFRSEYYGMVAHVHEQADWPAGVPLVTTGLIDLGHCAWGERPARIGRRAWDRPVLDVPSLEGRAATWAARTLAPKLVVATQTRVVEVALDESGAWVPAVPLVVVLAPPERLWALAAALASPPVTAWLLQRAAGAGLSPRALKVSAALVRAVPLPVDQQAWQAGVAAFATGDLPTFAEAMTEAYDAPAEVAEWWAERAGTVWFRAGVSR